MNPEVSFGQYSNFRQKGSHLGYNLLISLCYSMNVKPFEKIYQNFVPVKDYNRSYFKIVNKHLKYLELMEWYYLKHRREEDIDEKKFDLIWLCPKKLESYLVLTVTKVLKNVNKSTREDTRETHEQLVSKFEN